MHDHRCRGRYLSGPRRAEGGVLAALPGVPRDEAGPLRRSAASLEAGGHHAVRAEEVLHGGQGPSGPGIGVAHPTPELGLADDGASSAGAPIDRRLAQPGQFTAPPPGHLVAGDAIGPEPAEHLGLGQCSEVAQGADAQPT